VAAFSFNEFYQRNRRVVIWVILFLLLWLLRDFFTLVFLTFVLAIVAAPIAEVGMRRLKLPHWAAVTVVYVIFLGVLFTFVRFVAPSVVTEVNRMIENLPATEATLIETKNRLVRRYPALREPINGYVRSALADETLEAVESELSRERQRLELTAADLAAAAEAPVIPTGALDEYFNRQDQLLLNEFMAAQRQRLSQYAPAVTVILYRATATTLLALLFSYLILIDLNRLKAGIGRLRTSRVGDFYEEAAPPIARFGMLLGRAVEAQAAIAVVNTVLTLIGLLLLDIPLVAMLSVIVFVCSFVPVLGVFISTTPIVLVALNTGGPGLSLAAIALVIVIHAIEAYVLNPFIYGRHLKLNPVLTLIILYVGYHAFGLWGMLLGVPVSRYFIHDVLGVPFRERGRAARAPAPGGS
jgi:predicted PurR-regulated permease PerM